jgi:hypothetical protein
MKKPKKTPAQTPAAMKVRVEWAHQRICFLCWQEGDLLFMEGQEIEIAG